MATFDEASCDSTMKYVFKYLSKGEPVMYDEAALTFSLQESLSTILLLTLYYNCSMVANFGHQRYFDHEGLLSEQI